MNGIWAWLVAGLILGCLLIFANQIKTVTNEKPRKKTGPSYAQLSVLEANSEEEIDDEDDLLEEFLIIDLLDEEEEK